jgi:twitching motility protein PilT
MPKIDTYLRSIERFGAHGALLTSGQTVTLRFPSGDRHATQVTPHDQLIALVREVAPPSALEHIDKARATRFDFESNGARWALSVTPKPGNWQVAIELAHAAPVPAVQMSAASSRPVRASTPVPPSEDTELPIERGPYAVETTASTATASGSALLDALTANARTARATDVYIATGAPPVMRVAGELHPAGDRGALDAETIARELGVVAPAHARAAWSERGFATFAYGDGGGRVRATLVRDIHGPGAALRLLVGEAPPADRVGLGGEILSWLDRRGLVLIAGTAGSGKTTTLAALVRALGERRRRVVALEDPIEIIQTGPTISQRQIGDHAPTLAEGIAVAMREAADAIVVGAVADAEAAIGVLDAVAAGHLVLATIPSPNAREAVERLLEHLPADRRERGRAIVAGTLLGTLAPVPRGTLARAIEAVPAREE